jgi:hypothetical protein
MRSGVWRYPPLHEGSFDFGSWGLLKLGGRKKSSSKLPHSTILPSYNSSPGKNLSTVMLVQARR